MIVKQGGKLLNIRILYTSANVGTIVDKDGQTNATSIVYTSVLFNTACPGDRTTDGIYMYVGTSAEAGSANDLWLHNTDVTSGGITVDINTLVPCITCRTTPYIKTRFIGESSTVITDGGTQSPTVNDVVVPTSSLRSGDVVVYSGSVFMWSSNAWRYISSDLSTASNGFVYQHTFKNQDAEARVIREVCIALKYANQFYMVAREVIPPKTLEPNQTVTFNFALNYV